MQQAGRQPVTQDTPRDGVIRTLRGVLDRDNSLSRCCAVRALGRLQADDPETLRHLSALLHDADPDVRLDVAVILGHLGQAESAAPLIESLLGDPEGEVRIEAVRALAKLRATSAVEPLIRCLREDGLPELDLSVDDLEFGDSLEVQGQALNALGRIGDRRATMPVVDILSNPDYEDLQENGFEVLSQLDDGRARRFLLEQLAGGAKPLARRRAARALAAPARRESCSGEVGEVTRALIHALRDADPAVRISSGWALAGVDHPSVTAPLTALLNDTDEQVRVEAAAILVHARSPGVIEQLLGMLNDVPIEVRPSIAEILGVSGDPRAVPALQRMLASEEEECLRYQAVTALGLLALPGPEQELAAILKDPACHANLRVQAATALGKIAGAVEPGTDGSDPDPRQILKALEVTVSDGNSAVAMAALTALTGLMTPQEAVVFLAALLDGGAQVAGATADQPAAKEETATDSVPPAAAAPVDQPIPEPLRELVGAHSAQTSTLASILAAPANGRPPENRGTQADVPAPVHSVQVLAAALLGQKAKTGSAAVPALIQALERGDTQLSRESLAALGRIGDLQAVDPVLQCLDSKDEDVRLAAIDALAGIGKRRGTPVLDSALSALLDDPQGAVRERAVRALAETGGELAAQHLPRMLADEDRSVCRWAMTGLTPAMACPELSSQLLGNLFRFSADLRHDAAAGLRRLNDSDSTTELLDLLQDTEREAVHWICIDALGEIHRASTRVAAG